MRLYDGISTSVVYVRNQVLKLSQVPQQFFRHRDLSRKMFVHIHVDDPFCWYAILVMWSGFRLELVKH